MAPEREADEVLLCPACAASHSSGERFCRTCGVPLVLDDQGQRDPSARHQRARKIKPQLSEGRLVRVAGARNQVEGEFIQSMLLEEGVPSLLRRSAGFDVPDFLAAGPRDVMVPQSGAGVAREILLQAELVGPTAGGRLVTPLRLLAGMAVALAVGVLVVWVGLQLLR